MINKAQIPNFLSLTRLLLGPILLPFFLVYLLPLEMTALNVLMGVMFIALGLTDYFDGYFARRFGVQSKVGQLLDHLSDKVLVGSCLISLVAAGRLFFFWAVVLIGREFFAMGLRNLALQYNFDVPVDWLGKIKTASLMVLITFLIINPYAGKSIVESQWNVLQAGLLATAIVLSVWSAYRYYQSFLNQYLNREQAPPPEQIP